jgi:hypothetical protein
MGSMTAAAVASRNVFVNVIIKPTFQCLESGLVGFESNFHWKSVKMASNVETPYVNFNILFPFRPNIHA